MSAGAAYADVTYAVPTPDDTAHTSATTGPTPLNTSSVPVRTSVYPFGSGAESGKTKGLGPYSGYSTMFMIERLSSTFVGGLVTNVISLSSTRQVSFAPTAAIHMVSALSIIV